MTFLAENQGSPRTAEAQKNMHKSRSVLILPLLHMKNDSLFCHRARQNCGSFGNSGIIKDISECLIEG